MLRAFFTCIGFALISMSVSSCGGTDVGNAANFELSLGGTNDSYSSMVSMGLSTRSASISTAIFSIRAVALRPSTDCSASTPNTSTWTIKKENQILDYLSDTPIRFDLSTSISEICHIRLLLGPAQSGPYAGKSIYIQGVDQGSIPYTIQSTRFHPIVLVSSSRISTTNLDQVRNLLYRSQILASPDFSSLSENPALITPDTHPVAFGLVMTQIRRAARAFGLANRNSSNPSASSANGVGDESIDTAEAAETN